VLREKREENENCRDVGVVREFENLPRRSLVREFENCLGGNVVANPVAIP